MFFFGMFPFFLFILLGVSIFRLFNRGRGGSRKFNPFDFRHRVSSSARGFSKRGDFVDESEFDKQSARNLDGRIFRLAQLRGGQLTLSDVVVETGLSVKNAEQYMETLSDGTHVSLEVDESGRMIYLFPEIIARKRIDPDERNEEELDE